MTYPQYPQMPVAPQYPPQPQYPTAPPAPQYPPQPAYPAGYPQQYPAPPPMPPAQPLPTGTLDDFYNQPSTGGGPSFKFMDANRNPLVGKSYAGIVARAITSADIRAQTANGQVQTRKDGSPKWVMVVPMIVQPSQEFPDGTAGWWVKGQARDELARAMAEAGAPTGPPEAGAGITVTLTGTRPVPGFNPQFLYRVTYQRPAGAPPVQSSVEAPAQPVQQVPVPQPVPAQPVQQVQVPQPAAPAQAPVQVAAAPPGLDAEQQALLARLTNDQTG